MKYFTSIFFSLIILLTSCQQNKTIESQDGKEIPFAYAQLVKVWEYDGFRKLEIINPWDSASLLQTYLLVDKTKELPSNLPDGVVIRTPLEKSAVFTTVHCSAIEELGAVNSIAGVTDLEYVSNPTVAELTKNGKIADLGSGMSPDVEKIITVSPDAILLSPFKNSGGHGELDKLGIPIFECADYMEHEPLGRAEWIRVYGMLYGKESIADSIFNNVALIYKRIELETGYSSVDDTHVRASLREKPSVLYGIDFNGAWYVPGGKSYMAKMFASAGANYIFKETTHVGSEAFTFETVFDKGYDADVWLFLYNESADKTYKDLTRFEKFKSVKNRNVFACNTAKSHYYDEIPFHPDRLLKDLSVIFNPNCEGKLIYYRYLKE
ncbi:MAG: ABC transporter substrate-binding protein [Paludibacteraceae bacterium]|nr:ABC transporter substrate-binding protein [Paludibacteraceae bacterium]